MLVQMAMDCTPDEVFPTEESDSIAATVQAVAAKEENLRVSPIFNVVATIIETFCAAPQQRQLMAGFNHRYLPTSSKARDFL